MILEGGEGRREGEGRRGEKRRGKREEGKERRDKTGGKRRSKGGDS